MEDTSQNAPATSDAPSSAPAPAAAPTTAVKALEGAAARSAAPQVPAAGAQPNGAVVPAPAATAQAQPVVKTPGPIPFDAHTQALKNARDKAAEDAIQRFAWAKGLNPDEVKEALALRTRLHADPNKFNQDLMGELKGLEPEGLPEPDYVSKDGRYKTYSADAVAKIAKGIREQVMREVDGKLAPIMSEREAQEKAAQEEKERQDAIQAERVVIRQSLAHARTLPNFKENEKAISTKLGEIPKAVRMQVGLVAAMYMAYAAVLGERGLRAPAEAEQKVITDLRRKATAGAGNAQPGGQVPAAAERRPKNQSELAKHLERLSERATA